MSEATSSLPAGTTIVFPATPNPLAFIQLHADNRITLTAKHMEMGQGIYTGLATLIAEELDADPAQIRVVAAPHNPQHYGNPLIGGGQGTGGQTSIQASFMAMRSAGAAMRQMLLQVAARRWAMDPAQLQVMAGVVSASDGTRSATFGALALEAMAEPVPQTVTLKDPSAFRLIGKAFARLDGTDKVRGKTVYTQDLSLPGMLTAVIARPKRPGERIARFDDSAALAFPGVRHVVQVDAGIAVVADDFWTALEGRERLQIDWDLSQAFRKSSEDIYAELRALVVTPGAVAANTGDVDAALAMASTRLDSSFQVPYHAHAPMETLNIIAQLKDGTLDVWGGMQLMSMDQFFLSQAAGVAPEQVNIHMQVTGGSFGRRASPQGVYGSEVISILKALGNGLPVKLMYDRTDDMSGQHNACRPAFVHRIEAGLDAAGKLVAWRHRSAGQSILIGTLMEQAMVHEGIDWMSVEGAQDQAYQIPHARLEQHSPVYPIRPSWLRTSGVFHNAFAIEVMLDEVAAKAGLDPVTLRLQLLPAGSRERGCLEWAAEKSGWFAPLAPGAAGEKRGRGVAVAPAHRSYGAMVIEVTVAADAKSYRIDRVVAVMDCGLVINPDNVVSQMEGSVGFGLAMARFGEITFADGVVQQNFFSDYHITRMHTMPPVESYLVPSEQGPSGASETIACVVAPALANALAQATGKPFHQVPLRLPDEPAEVWDVPAGLNTFAGAKGWNPPAGWVPISERN
ncbi:MAG: xanthine dehydrogenase family protein molybdopterin-binding subunit [Rhodoferax sp.]|nr:xanthine dehydrogenase family protein molybdopterin-binding subunit [Rhodoferax sp.]